MVLTESLFDLALGEAVLDASSSPDEYGEILDGAMAAHVAVHAESCARFVQGETLTEGTWAIYVRGECIADGYRKLSDAVTAIEEDARNAAFEFVSKHGR